MKLTESREITKHRVHLSADDFLKLIQHGSVSDENVEVVVKKKDYMEVISSVTG
jgi:hypothetical protein